MHDIDRTLSEFETTGFGETGFGPDLKQQAKGGRVMWEQEYNQEFNQEFNEFQGENFEFAGEMPGEMMGEMYGEMPLNEAQEMELAAELLSVTGEAELDQFIGKIMKRAARAIKSPVGRALGGILKGVARKALPMVGGALGSFVAPGIGTAIGSSLGSAAGKLFGLEMEGLSNEDREFEVARRYVRFASAAARNAAAYPSRIPPMFAAKRALSSAARAHAPGLLSCPSCSPMGPYGENTAAWTGGAAQSGRWIRRGRNIIILGV